MKKYRLIKELPFEESPEVGYISEPMPPREPLHYWNHHWFDPAKYPEYWMEVSGKPVFRSTDGVDIYEGDIIYGIYNNIDKTFHEKVHESKYLMYHKWRRGVFSTKEAAEESIIMNRHCLSIKEITPIIGMANETTYIDLDSLTRNLKTLVKSKL